MVPATPHGTCPPWSDKSSIGIGVCVVMVPSPLTLDLGFSAAIWAARLDCQATYVPVATSGRNTWDQYVNRYLYNQ